MEIWPFDCNESTAFISADLMAISEEYLYSPFSDIVS